MSDELILKIVGGVIIFVLILPSVAWRIYIRWRFSQDVKDALSKPFVCPMCGFRFYRKGKIIFSPHKDKALLKCPSCGKRSVCGRPYDIDSSNQ